MAQSVALKNKFLALFTTGGVFKPRGIRKGAAVPHLLTTRRSSSNPHKNSTFPLFSSTSPIQYIDGFPQRQLRLLFLYLRRWKLRLTTGPELGVSHRRRNHSNFRRLSVSPGCGRTKLLGYLLPMGYDGQTWFRGRPSMQRSHQEQPR